MLNVDNRKKFKKKNDVCVRHQVLVIVSETVTGCCHSSCQLMLLGGLTHREQVHTEPWVQRAANWGPKKTKCRFLAERRVLSVYFAHHIHLNTSPTCPRDGPPNAVWPSNKMQQK